MLLITKLSLLPPRLFFSLSHSLPFRARLARNAPHQWPIQATQVLHAAAKNAVDAAKRYYSRLVPGLYDCIKQLTSHLSVTSANLNAVDASPEALNAADQTISLSMLSEMHTTSTPSRIEAP